MTENLQIMVLEMERVCNPKRGTLLRVIPLCEGNDMPSHILYNGRNRYFETHPACDTVWQVTRFGAFFKHLL